MSKYIKYSAILSIALLLLSSIAYSQISHTTHPKYNLTYAFGSLSLGGGTISGSTVTEFATASAIGTVTEDELGGKWFFVTSGTDTIVLPEITETGHSACFYAVSDAVAITIDIDITDKFILDGTAKGVGVTIVSPAAEGDFICIISKEVGGADEWITLGRSGTWT
jgi:hypothetical protein